VRGHAEPLSERVVTAPGDKNVDVESPTVPDPERIAQPRVPPRSSPRKVVLTVAVVAAVLTTAATLALRTAYRQKAIATQASAPSAAASAAAACPDGMVRVPAAGAIRAFCMDRTEVTTEEYRPCADAAVCRPAGQRTEGPDITQATRNVTDPLCNARAPESRGAHPINCVDWEMAAAFCKARGKRLPTEAEWLRAAIGEAGPRAPWGGAPATAKLLNGCGAECVAWGQRSKVDVRPLYDGDDGFLATAPVGSFPSGAAWTGALDMFGNVAEWTSDAGDAQGTRVVKGGGFHLASLDAAATREVVPAEVRSVTIGFRCAR
jgi:hypothetical protein